MTRTAIVAAVLLVGSLPQTAAGQHPDRFGVYAVVPRSPTCTAAAAYRGGSRSAAAWGLHAVYDVSTPGDHWDHAASVWVAKSFGPPDDSVPYLLVGGAAIGYHTYGEGEGGAWAAPGDRQDVTPNRHSRRRRDPATCGRERQEPITFNGRPLSAKVEVWTLQEPTAPAPDEPKPARQGGRPILIGAVAGAFAGCIVGIVVAADDSGGSERRHCALWAD